jgi:hypothetical protein
MTSKPQPGKTQSVMVIEADIFDRMNETDALIAQRAYEIYKARSGGHGPTKMIGSPRNKSSCTRLRSNAM